MLSSILGIIDPGTYMDAYNQGEMRQIGVEQNREWMKLENKKFNLAEMMALEQKAAADKKQDWKNRFRNSIGSG